MRARLTLVFLVLVRATQTYRARVVFEIGGAAATLHAGADAADDARRASAFVREHGLRDGAGCDGDEACIAALVARALADARDAVARLAALRGPPLLALNATAATGARAPDAPLWLAVRYALAEPAGLCAAGARVCFSTRASPPACVPCACDVERGAIDLSISEPGSAGAHAIAAWLEADDGDGAAAPIAEASATYFAPDAETGSYWNAPRTWAQFPAAGGFGFSARVDAGKGTYGVEAIEVLSWGDAARLVVGAFSSISPCTVFLGGEHRLEWATTFPFPAFEPRAHALVAAGRTDGKHAFSKGDVRVGSDVFIGRGATLLSGVTVGDGAVVGARAVVAKDVPPYAVAVGNPARVVKYRFDNATIARLLEVRWWDWPDARIAQEIPHLLRAPDALLAAAGAAGGS